MFFRENVSQFFTFWNGFFTDFQNFGCYESGKWPLLIRIVYLFTSSVGKRRAQIHFLTESLTLLTMENLLTPDQVKICPPVHPTTEFFFRADSGATKWNCSRRNVKKDVQKSDIALVEWSRFNEYISGTGQVHIRYTLGTYQVHVRYISGTFRVHIRYIGWLAGRICLRRRRNLPRGFILVIAKLSPKRVQEN